MGCCISSSNQVKQALEDVRAENKQLRLENEKLRQQLDLQTASVSHEASASDSQGSPVTSYSQSAASVGGVPISIDGSSSERDNCQPFKEGNPPTPSLSQDSGLKPAQLEPKQESLPAQPMQPARQTDALDDSQENEQSPIQLSQESSSQPYAGLKRGFLNSSTERRSNGTEAVSSDMVSSEAAEASALSPERPLSTTSYSFSVAGGQHAKEELGACLLCLEQLPNDPRQVVNLCASEPRCLCLLHRTCFLNPEFEMTDMLRRCMVCKQPAVPSLVRMAVQARQRPLHR